MIIKLGSTYKSTSLLLGIKVNGTNLVTKFSRNQELELENTTGTVKYNVNYRLTASGSETKLTCTTSVFSDNRVFAFTTPVLKMLAQRELQTDLAALKIAVEQGLK